jgi:hypothetical protein
MSRIFALIALTAAQPDLSPLLSQPYMAPTPGDVSQTYHFVDTAIGLLHFRHLPITYSEVDGKDCDSRLPASFDDDAFTALLCSTQGKGVPSLDGPGSPALCGTLAEMQDICSEIESCHSVTFQKDHGARGYLNGFGCAETANVNDEPGTAMYIKDVGTMKDCPLGEGVQVTSPYAMVHGVYEKVDPKKFSHIDTLSTVEWDDTSNCGWIVWRSTLTTTPAPAPVPGCTDNNAMVNELFGFTGANVVDDICSMAGSWGDGSYCYNGEFAALCSATCSTDCKKDAPGLCAEADCTDALDDTICPETCARRRLTDGGELVSALHSKRALTFRAAMRDASLNFKHGRRMQIKAAEARRATAVSAGRQLAWTTDLMYEEVYRTFAPNATVCGKSHTDNATMTKTGLYDLVAYHYPVGISFAHSCPGGKKQWNAIPDGEGKYCQLSNIPTLYTTMKEVADHQCNRKCSFLDYAKRTVDTIDPATGENNWCSGNQELFEIETDALCLPREECERLCESIPECHSIDMHRFLPQCYLNKMDDCWNSSEWIANYSWDVLMLTETPDEANATHDGERDVFTTQTGVNCSNENLHGLTYVTPPGPTGIARGWCEHKCRLDVNCTGFILRSADLDWSRDQSDLEAGTQFEYCMFLEKGAGGCDVKNISTGLEIYVDEEDILFPELGGRQGLMVSQYKVVTKEPHDDCIVDVTTPEGGKLDKVPWWTGKDLHITGSYTKVQGGVNYLRDDNKTRIHYETAGGDLACDGWYLEHNMAPTTEETRYNCTDNPRLANFFLKEFGGADGKLMYPCQHGFDSGKCSDPVFSGLCAHTCQEFQSITVAGTSFLFQDNELYGETTYNSTCDGDNNWAAFHWERVYRFANPKALVPADPIVPDTDTASACDKIAAFGYNFTHTACGHDPDLDWSGVFKYLCPDTCSIFTPPEEQITYRDVDETSDVGALYGITQLRTNRRLGEKLQFYEDRRLQVSGITTSNSGLPEGRSVSITVEYLDGYAPDSSWAKVYQTWRPMSNDTASPYAGAKLGTDGVTPVAGGACPMGTPLNQSAFDMLKADHVFQSELMIDPQAKLERVCRGAAICPRFTTCVVSPLRFADEIELAFGGTQFDFLTPAFALTLDLDAAETEPKVVVSEYRSTAIVAQQKFEMGATLFRNVPGATRATLTKFGADTDVPEDKVLIMSMVSPTAASGYYARTELSKTYTPPAAGFSAGFLSDVLRVETFGKNSTGDMVAMDADVSFDVYLGPVMAPELLRVAKISPDGTMSLVATAPDDYNPDTQSLSVSVEEFPGDFIVLLADDPCATASPCDAKAICTNVKKGDLDELEASCECRETYVGSGLEGDCALDPHFVPDDKSDTSSLDYYLRISHADVLNFGWRIKEIELYADEECTQKLSFASVRQDFETAYGFSPGYGSETDTTFEKITKDSQVYSGPIGEAHYPHPEDMTGNPTFKYGNKNVFDGKDDEWWSGCLNCNPDTPAFLEFMVKGSVRIQCIKVIQDENHFSSSITVERGPIKGPTGCGESARNEWTAPECECGMHPSQPRCEPSMSWTSMVPPEAVLKTTCGTGKMQIFGELLLVTGTGWEGSYANDHPVQSACHCHQLCVEHLGQGCVAWKYYDEASGIKHCYLQSSVFEDGQGFYGASSSKNAVVATEWTSGKVSQRYVKNSRILEKPYLFSTDVGFQAADLDAALEAGEAMTITVTGTGLPYSSNKANDASDLQRIKIVEEDTGCEVIVPKEVSGISCIESVKSVELLAGTVETKVYTFCGPRPSTKEAHKATAHSVTFEGIKISRADEDRTYKVCYCAFDCFEPSRWQSVPGTIEVKASVFSWATEPAVIYRKDRIDDQAMPVKLTITRPAFGSHTPQGSWKLKLIKDWYSCSVTQNPAVIGTSNLDPESCDGPDVCTWSYTLKMALEDVGRYLVCFSEDGTNYVPVPAGDGRKYVEILRLDADFEHPRGIFHNQQFSVLAGHTFPVPLSLVGTRMAVPTAAAVTFTQGPCGDASKYSFTGSVVPALSSDTTAPTLVPEDSYPKHQSGDPTANGGAGLPAAGDKTAIMLAFSEPITNKDCGDTFIYVREQTGGADNIQKTIECSDPKIQIWGNKLLLPWEDVAWTASDAYFVEIQTGAVSDMAGNDFILDVTTTTLSWTVQAEAATAIDTPTVLRTIPDDQGNFYNGTITIVMNEKVAPADAADATLKVVIVACGTAAPEFVCTSDDSVVSSYALVDDSLNTITLTPGTEVKPNGRYQVTIKAASIADLAGTPGTLAADYVFEFVYDDNGFSVADVVPVQKTSSSATEMVFHVQLGADTPDGRYSVCYCSGQLDLTLAQLGDYATRYKLHEDKECSNTARVTPSTTVEIMDKTLEEHVCASKCGKGCIGPHCFCEGYAGKAGANTLCLPKQLCAEACDAVTGCTGIVVHDDLPQCELLSAACDTGGKTEEEYQYFEAASGSACTHFQDFDESAGALVVTSRVDVAVDYVFTPNKEGTIELTAPASASFTYGDAGLLSKDRITVIDCGGTCGVSSPTKSISMPLNAASIETWNDFAAASYFHDPAHVDVENPELAKVIAASAADSMRYTTDGYEGKYVPMANLVVSDFADTVPIDGALRDLAEFQCFEKCADGCTGEHCYCDGYLPGVDAKSSNALCASKDLCMYLCDSVGEACQSIDMHATLPRCFLNAGTTTDFDNRGNPIEVPVLTHVDALASDPDYNVLLKRYDVNQEHLRKLQTSILEVEDMGYSWDKLLRFKGITFSSGGTFKLCFCDSSLLGGSNSACRSEADYSVEVGTIHASGVSCLIAKPELQRVSCVPQFGPAPASLRCYKQYASPPNPTPPPIGPITDATYKTMTKAGGAAGVSASTKCAMMSEEEAKADPVCQANSEQ